MQLYIASGMQVYMASCTIWLPVHSSQKTRHHQGHWTDDGSIVSELLIVCTNEGTLGWRPLQVECAACERNMFKVELLVL